MQLNDKRVTYWSPIESSVQPKLPRHSESWATLPEN